MVQTKVLIVKQALAMLRPKLKKVVEGIFPKAAYDRRFRLWLKTEPELRLLPALCRRDALALDIGANEGFFAHHLLPLALRVIAFEPLPEMLVRLRDTYADKMEIIGVALSDHVGQSELRYPAGGYMTATIAASNLAAFESGRVVETVVVSMKTLDSFDLTNVGFVKIDVEGHEEAVLHGGLNTLKREMPNMMIEIEGRHAPGSLDRVSALLSGIGYLGYYLEGNQLLPIARFDPDRDQTRQNINTGDYINNFLFFPQERAMSLLEDARLYL
jgi:FkbM family methyltransferase